MQRMHDHVALHTVQQCDLQLAGSHHCRGVVFSLPPYLCSPTPLLFSPDSMEKPWFTLHDRYYSESAVNPIRFYTRAITLEAVCNYNITLDHCVILCKSAGYLHCSM